MKTKDKGYNSGIKGLKRFFTSPYFLSLIPFLVIAFLLQNGFSRYIIQIETITIPTKDCYYWYKDLDKDGISEEIVAINEPNSTGLAFSTDHGIINQFSFKGTFNFLSKSCLFITGDKDENGMDEVYVFTLSSDSIFLHCIPNFKDSLQFTTNRFIATTGPGIKSPDPFIIPAEMDDLDGDGIKELIFGIGSGFSIYPRRVFAFYVLQDSLVASPESSSYIWKIFQTDITGDGTREIIPYGYATSNVPPEQTIYHDFSSYLTVLDQNLRFLYNPLEFKGKYSKLTPFAISSETGNSLGFLFNTASGQATSTIYYADAKGSITDTLPLKFYAVDCFSTSYRDKKNMKLLVIPKNKLGLFNASFELVKLIDLEEIYSIFQTDFDSDGKNEILITAPHKGKIFIYREGLVKPVTADISFQGFNEDIFSMKINKSSAPGISFQSGQKHYILKYGQNPGYPYSFLLYPGLYLAVLAFALLIKNVQKNQLKKKYENEKKISQLQLAIIRNQLDPHFTLNVINSIICSIEFSDKDLAGEQLRRFANLYRNLLLSASSIQRSIGEELDFCNEYLLLEKMRFGEKINYEVSVSGDVDKNILIPKLLIQIHVENAVKHGLTSLDKGGILNINLKMVVDDLLIEIIDNGIGRAKAGSQIKLTTGKGLEIMNELYSIYNKYYKEKISSEITDLYHDDGQSAGTLVAILISNLK